jgi:hypothetical protein
VADAETFSHCHHLGTPPLLPNKIAAFLVHPPLSQVKDRMSAATSTAKRTLGFLSAVGTAMAFPVTPLASTGAAAARYSFAVNVAVDPSVITKKEYQDICGVSFDQETMEQRLRRTNFLYPKHVEVIEDIAPIAGAMVDEIVSGPLRIT